MYAFLDDLFKVIAPWPIVFQVAIVGLIAFFGIMLMRKGERDRKLEDQSKGLVPMWAMMGPVHEGIQAVHDMAEETRNTNNILREIAETLHGLDKGQIYVIQLLEDLNNSSVTTGANVRARKRPP